MIAKFGSTANYFLSDRLSVRLSINPLNGSVTGRQAHLPFGEDFAESGTQDKHHFTSYERDSESGVDYAMNRGYSSTVGRFQSADPYRPSGHKVNPQSWNRFAYTRNNPVNRVDRFGLEDEPPDDENCYIWYPETEEWDVISCDPVGLDGSAESPGSPDGDDNIDPADLLPGGGTMIGNVARMIMPVRSASTQSLPILDLAAIILDQAIDIAQAALAKESCQGLLNGPGVDALTKLQDLRRDNQIRFGETVMVDMPDGSRRPAAAHWDGRSIVLANSFIRVGAAHYGDWSNPAESRNLDPSQNRARTILHEIGHATGSPNANHYTDGKLDFGKSDAYNRAIAANCF